MIENSLRMFGRSVLGVLSRSADADWKEATGGSCRFPRILFVNEFPPDSLAVLLVRQLLVGYPEDRIAWWCWRSSSVAGLKGLKPRSIYRFGMPARVLPA